MYKSAVIQLNSQPDLNKSLTDARTWVERASEDGAVFICLPENFAFLGEEREKFENAKEIQKEVESQLPEWAKHFGVTILAGGYPVLTSENKIFNRSVIYTPNGSVAASYDKIHLFDVELSEKETYRESETVKAGVAEPVLFESDSLGSIGLSICYDLRFPELYRKLSRRGADVLTVPSAFTRPTGEAHWSVLLRARAIENCAYVLAPAQTGKHGKRRETFGNSMIIDPWGRVIGNLGDKPGYIIADIDLEVVRETRRKLPSLEHRRL